MKKSSVGPHCRLGALTPPVEPNPNPHCRLGAPTLPLEPKVYSSPKPSPKPSPNPTPSPSPYPQPHPRPIPGAGVKLTNCILMDHVVVHDKVTMSDCIIARALTL